MNRLLHRKVKQLLMTLITKKGGDSYESVSYTHLDVYKRQDLISLDEYLKKLNASVTPNDPDDGENVGGGNEGGDEEAPATAMITFKTTLQVFFILYK